MRTLPPLVRRTVDRLIAAFAPEEIRVFGSYAKDTQHAGSDVDLLVVARLGGQSAEAHMRRARQLAADCFPAVDVVLCTPAERDGAARLSSPFLASILETGQVIYQRDGESGLSSTSAHT